MKFLKKEEQDVNGGRCLREINGRFLLSEKDWKTSVMVPIYKRKGDATNCKSIQRSEVIGTWNEDR